jgi:tetratricopeptide (TPR) repeat protein
MALQELLRQALRAQNAGNLVDAQRLYQLVLAADPGNFDANHLIAMMRFQQGRNAEALAFLQTALAAVPKAVEALSHQGLVLHMEGRNLEALASLQRALAINPVHAEALNHQGMVLRALGRTDNALASLGAALAIDPDFAGALNNLGIVLRDAGRTREALDAFDRATALEPGNPEILFNRGLLLRELGRCADAAACFQKLLSVWPDHPAVLNNLGLVLFECDRVEEAMQLFRRHAEMQHGRAPDNSAVLPESKTRHDREQQDYLDGREPGRSRAQYRLADGARLRTPAINPGNNIDDICAHWDAARPQVVVIDDLLTSEALEGLRRFCLESTAWQKTYAGGYLGALPEHGFACPLLAQIAEEFRSTYGGIFGAHHLRYLWGFKYDSALSGINIHADFAAVNVNFWITPDEANLDAERSGLVIWDVAAPLDWDFAKYNDDEAAIRNFLAESGARSTTVPYRANRAVIFDSDLFHETDRIAFKEGYTNRRVNITLLYGRRRSHEGMAAAPVHG